MADRRLVVVDTETTGLKDSDIVVEIAWLDTGTGDHGSFIPAHDVEWVKEHAHPDALEINGYWSRIDGHPQDDGTELYRLHMALRGQSLAGSNVRYDARKLAVLFETAGMHPEPFHYHLTELASYTAGVLGLKPTDLPGLASCCELFEVKPGDHSAEEDVRATAECFAALDAIIAERAVEVAA